MIDTNHSAVQALVKLVGGKPVRAAKDACSQGGPDAYVVDSNENPVCGQMRMEEAKAIANMINLAFAPVGSDVWLAEIAVGQALIALTDGRPVRAVRDGCAQGEPDGYILYASGAPMCGFMWLNEAKAIAEMINLILEESGAPATA